MSLDYRDVDTWPLPNGDVVVIVKRTYFDEFGAVHSFTWHIRARNGQKVGGGGETYTRKSSAKRAALRHHPRVES